MARAAVPWRLTWRVATVKEIKDETATARTLTLDIPGWPGHDPGQHVAGKPTAAGSFTFTGVLLHAKPPHCCGPVNVPLPSSPSAL